MQRKDGGERGRRKINHIYIILSGRVTREVEKEKKRGGGGKKVHCLAVVHPRTRLCRIRLAPDAANPLSMCRAKVKAIQKCGSAPITSEFRPDESNQWQHQSWREEQTKPIDWFDTHRGKRESGSSQQSSGTSAAAHNSGPIGY